MDLKKTRIRVGLTDTNCLLLPFVEYLEVCFSTTDAIFDIELKQVNKGIPEYTVYVNGVPKVIIGLYIDMLITGKPEEGTANHGRSSWVTLKEFALVLFIAIRTGKYSHILTIKD